MQKRREKTFEITCPSCGHKFTKNLATAIFNDDDEFKEIMTGHFGSQVCPSCSHEFVLNYRFAYTDEENLFMIVNDPAFVDRKARLAFSTSLGLIGGNRKDELYKYDLRITYNYDQLFEKIAIFTKGLDDKVVELMKYFLLYSDDFAYKPEQIKKFNFTREGDFYLETVLNVGLKLKFSDVLYDTIINNYGEKLKTDISYMVDNMWASDFLAE